ncbi:MAG: long-chain fatty acid--CoA ligase [Candidatus Tectomicrobia bacterium]|uniref:Long-chain fatty acid--CoA ligase n=1 Tax=Tectimicrobiota bacterium TaxID=2528274 RepID=A0A932M1J7_UNCTE|nr:long-chain fatty acid--CoA ligase [Candidatus Tectomicrobia bacterium]
MEQPWHKFYDEGVPHTLNYPRLSLPELLEESGRVYGQRPALIFFGTVLTYRKLLEQINRLAAALAALGVGERQRVALLFPNCPQTVIAYYAVLKLGGIVVQTNPLYKEEEIVHQWRDAGCETAIVLDRLFPPGTRLWRETPVRQVVLTTLKDYLSFPKATAYAIKMALAGEHRRIDPHPGIFSWTDLLRSHPPSPPRRSVDPESVALLQYTGGTTGTAKGAMLTHRNLVSNAVQLIAWTPRMVSGRERFLGVLPFFHAYGMTAAMNLPLARGLSVILLPRFDVREVLQAIGRYKPTAFPGVPAMFLAILSHPRVKTTNMSSIAVAMSGASALPAGVTAQFEAMTGGSMFEGYGLTEASPVTHSNPLYSVRKEGSIGVPLPDTEARIVDSLEGKRELPPGEVGELCVKGPQIMAGFWNREEETREVLRGGWLYTGDLARRDEDGFFYIVDRKKDLIIVMGYNVYPVEVEEVLKTHPLILEAAVVGVRDRIKGEVVKAFVVPRPGARLLENEVKGFCRKHLAAFKVPAQVEFRQELPKTLIGKVLRKDLRRDTEADLPGD